MFWATSGWRSSCSSIPAFCETGNLGLGQPGQSESRDSRRNCLAVGEILGGNSVQTHDSPEMPVAGSVEVQRRWPCAALAGQVRRGRQSLDPLRQGILWIAGLNGALECVASGWDGHVFGKAAGGGHGGTGAVTRGGRDGGQWRAGTLWRARYRCAADMGGVLLSRSIGGRDRQKGRGTAFPPCRGRVSVPRIDGGAAGALAECRGSGDLLCHFPLRPYAPAIK